MESRDRDIIMNELGLDPDKKTVLLMGGSVGAGNIKNTLDVYIRIVGFDPFI